MGSKSSRNCKLPQRSAQGAEPRPEPRLAKQPAQAVDVARKDVLPDVGSEVVVTDELGDPRERLRHSAEERVAEIMDCAKRYAPVSAHIFQYVQHVLGVFRGDFPALQDLLAERIQADQKHAAAFLTRAVDVEDVASALAHLVAKEENALLVYHLEVRHEFLGHVADRSRGDLHVVLPQERRADLADLPALQEPIEAHTDQHVIHDFR